MHAPSKYLLIGILLALPFFMLNALVATGSPIAGALRDEMGKAGYEQVLILGLLSLVLIGGMLSLYPAVKTRRLMMLNLVVGVLLMGFAIFAGYGLGVDVYNCDVLKIPNCD